MTGDGGDTAAVTGASPCLYGCPYAVSALAPLFAADLGLPRSGVGLLVATTFAVAAGTSLVAGHGVDLAGGTSRPY